jgi:hypothetical protein
MRPYFDLWGVGYRTKAGNQVALMDLPPVPHKYYYTPVRPDGDPFAALPPVASVSWDLASAAVAFDGNGSPTVTAAAGARAGLHQAVCVASATNGGTFRVIDPTGVDLGAVAVGAATTLGGVTWTLADGSTDFAKGDRVYALVGALHAYQATAVAGDTKTHATTEPTWPTNGTTVTDDQVTWTDLGAVDDLRDHPQCGVLAYSGDAFSTGAGEHPTLPVILTGQVRLAELAGLPAAYVAGDALGTLILEA